MEENKKGELVFVALSEPENIRNNIYGDILNEFSKYFEKIHVVCIGDNQKTNRENIHFYSYPIYYWPKIFLKLNKKNVSKIFITDYFVGGFIATIFSKMWKIPMVYRCGGPWHYENNTLINMIKNSILKLTKPFVIKNCQKVVYNSKSIVEKIIKHNYEVIYNGVDTDLFKPIEVKKRTEKLNILFIGRICKEKGLNYLLEAIIGLEEKVHFGIVGEGKLRKNYEQKYPFVEFYGKIQKEKIPLIINQYDFLVLASLVESFPNVILEAMACGKPVIATDIYGIPEIVEDGINGFLVPTKNVRILRETINRFLEDKNLAKNMGNNARDLIAKKFQNEVQMKKLICSLKL
ncbi:MAG: glycosyltransferase family 4 protein [Lutibacter sp.]|nr:glycosyltransferase family 4 protein [Lutibacter sp.]